MRNGLIAISLGLFCAQAAVAGNTGSSLHAAPKTHATGDNERVPGHFPRYNKIVEQIKALAERHPELATLHEIGSTAWYRMPIYALHIGQRQPEQTGAAVLISAVHHAREPVGAVLSLHIAETLLSGNHKNSYIQQFADSLSVWIVPVVNPDGYRYMMQQRRRFPWWRKNLRDNNGNGRIDPHVDGVDLNRNYDFNWQQGGDGAHSSWFYHGQEAASEPEVQALQQLAIRENIVAGVTLHSYGEAILYPWGNYTAAPDQDLIVAIAREMAQHLPRRGSQLPYSVYPLNGNAGQSSNWMYGRLRAIDYTLELARHYFPDRRTTAELVGKATDAVFVLMEKALHAGLRGSVRDARTGEPVPAAILVEGKENTAVWPRIADARSGRFSRILAPGSYTVQFRAQGYREAVFENVQVLKGEACYLDVALQRLDEYVSDVKKARFEGGKRE